MFEGHSLSQTILGSKENVLGFSKKDIKDYTAKRYLPENIVLTFVGNIDEEKVDKLIQNYFIDNLPKNSSSFESTAAEYKFGKRIRIDDFEQSNLIISYPSLSADDEKITALSYLNIILGASMSSRLFQEVREKLGLAYSIYTSPSTYSNNGAFHICLNVSPENTLKAYNATFRVITELTKNGITQCEFERAKEQLKSSLVFAQENAQSIMLVTGKTLLSTGKMYNIDEKLKNIDDTTINDVENFAVELLNKNFALSYVGKECDFIKKI